MRLNSSLRALPVWVYKQPKLLRTGKIGVLAEFCSCKLRVAILLCSLFLQFKEFELYWCAVFFKICSHFFLAFSRQWEVKLELWFWSLWNSKESEKSSRFEAWLLFQNSFKVEWEIGVWTIWRFLRWIFVSGTSIWFPFSEFPLLQCF